MSEGSVRKHVQGNVDITRRHADSARAAIKVSKIVKLLQDNAQGLLRKPNLKYITDPGAPYELTASQVKSAQILLDKALPSLQAIDVSSAPETPELSPDELKEKLQMVLVAMPKEEVMRMIGATTVEAEVIDAD